MDFLTPCRILWIFRTPCRMIWISGHPVYYDEGGGHEWLKHEISASIPTWLLYGISRMQGIYNSQTNHFSGMNISEKM